MQDCLNRVCLYERPGVCAPPERGEGNEVIASGPAMLPLQK